MDKVIEAARQLGRALQSDERYIKYAAAQQQNDEDAALQEAIEKFTNKRGELAEVQKNGGDEERLAELNTEVRELYVEIFQNENMARFNVAREEFGTLMAFVNQIISGSQNGLDPDSIEYQMPGCGSGCSSCSGCS